MVSQGRVQCKAKKREAEGRGSDDRNQFRISNLPCGIPPLADPLRGIPQGKDCEFKSEELGVGRQRSEDTGFKIQDAGYRGQRTRVTRNYAVSTRHHFWNVGILEKTIHSTPQLLLSSEAFPPLALGLRLISVQPETQHCHSERGEESPATQ